jgi:D-3-phosphoglycerate dehydrogenase
MPRILIADDVAPECLDILRGAELTAEQDARIDQGELPRSVRGFDGLIVRSRVQVTREVLEAGTELKIVGRAGIGTDNIDVDAATRRGILVMNTPQANVTAAAEHAFSLLLSLARNIPRADARVRAGGWDRKLFTGVELEGKTLGVLGLGKIGKQVARYAQAFGMKVVAFDPYLSEEHARRLDIHLVSLDEALERSDFVSVHVPLTAQTRNLLDRDRLAKMKRSARLINASRGGIVEEAALAEAVRSRAIAGAAVDVFEMEPPPPDHPLRGLDNVILTPHLGASTEEAQHKVAVDIAHQFVDFFRHGRVRNAVNLALPTEPALLPYQDLAGTLGHLASQLVSGRVDSIEITVAGEIADADTRALTAAAVRGVLRPICGDTVNLVNAPVLAEERHIRVIETRRKDVADYKNLVTVRLGGNPARIVSGTILEGRTPRIVNVEGYAVDLQVARYMLCMIYPDIPGVVGRFGTVMGRRGINIANMTVGRAGRGRRAVIFVTVDERVPPDVVDELSREIEGLEFIRSIELT